MNPIEETILIGGINGGPYLRRILCLDLDLFLGWGGIGWEMMIFFYKFM